MKLGLVHHRYMRGYKNVINEAKRLSFEGIFAPLAIETSGHGALSDNYYLDDGAYLAVLLVTAAAKAKRENKALESLIDGFSEAFEEREYRIPVLDRENFKSAGERALDLFLDNASKSGYYIVPNSYEGVRLGFPNGWMLLRKSLHDPLPPQHRREWSGRLRQSR
jgi:phosphomannomutase